MLDSLKNERLKVIIKYVISLLIVNKNVDYFLLDKSRRLFY